MPWISVCGWRRFQHYDPAKRQPPWIKSYVELLDDEDYLALTPRLRGILHGIWLAYAASRSQLGSNPARIGLRIGDNSVRARDIEALCDAGFIEIVASKALAEGYHAASARAHARDVETETDVETEKTSSRVTEQAVRPELQDVTAGLPAGSSEDDPEPELGASGPMAEDLRRELGRLRPRGAAA